MPIHGDPNKTLKHVNAIHRREGASLTHEQLDGILEVIGETSYPKYIDSGYHAAVFWLSDHKKVLKITFDYSDANAMEIVRKKPDPNAFLKVYEVYEVQPKKLYAIVAEKLTPLTDAAWDRYFKDFFSYTGGSMDALDYNNLLYSKGLSLEYVNAIEKSIEEHNKEMREIYQEMQEVDSTNVIKDSEDDWLTTAPSEEAYKILRRMGKALEQRRIVFHDFNQSNFMMRGRTPVIVDLGFGDSPAQHIQRLPYASERGL